jgi:D-arginine dehydrogenase
MSETRADFLVIGSGIAGASVAYELAAEARVLEIERESQPGYHSTGRSAAIYSETYGNAAIRALTTGSREFLLHPPADFTDQPLLKPRGTLIIGRADQREKLLRAFDDCRKLVPSIRLLERQEILARVPVIRPDEAALGVLEPDAMDIDVHAVHQGFLRGLRKRGGAIVMNAECLRAERRDGCWRLQTAAGIFAAPVVIDAAGAWAESFAMLCGAAPVGLVPKRRTVVIFSPPPNLTITDWPQVIDVDETFYFKPEVGRILATPADETPTAPCDVQPEEIDIATCLDRIERATTLKVPRVEQKWAGLRSFVADRTPVVGFDPALEGFFWLAGQGGYGIQTSSAMGRTAAALALGRDIPGDLVALGVDAAALSPARFTVNAAPR